MASTSRFSALPSINIGRSRWNMNHDHPTTWQHGKIIPLDCVRVMPGDTFKLNMASLIRMSQPIVPIMDNIRCNIYAFFVPMRLVWANTKKFFGENTESAGPQTQEFLIPAVKFAQTNNFGTVGKPYNFKAQPVVGSVSHYLGKPLVADSTSELDDPDIYVDNVYVSVLKERGYYLIYNEFFRPQQFIPPIKIYDDNTGRIGDNRELGSLIDFSSSVLTCCKQFDYFTSNLLSPQYGPAVEIPLGDYAPLGLIYDEDGDPAGYIPQVRDYTNGWGPGTVYDARDIVFGSTNNLSQDTDGLLGIYNHGADFGALASVDSSDQLTRISNEDFGTNLVVNLSTATAASINTLRAAFATQRFLERNNYGTRYHEYIQVHFGVKPPLGLLQVPELIGEHHFNINIQQVLSTAGAADDTSTTLGQPGANSTTGDKCMLFKKAFVEHGYVYVLMTTTHDRHYTAGILRDDLKREELEFYHPEFATLGDQATKRSEIQWRNNTAIDATASDVFGYQEHWAEYRYIPSRASGLLDPYAANGLSMWTLTNTYGIDVELDGAFLKEDRAALANALVTGLSGPDYIGDFYFNYDVVRPMPLYSIPGRIDHVGGW